MGERHQLFVIARRGKRYRCLSVVHHQWLYGKTALQRLLRLLRIFSHPSNRVALQQELAFSIIDNEKTAENGINFVQGSPHPFPFIATCLYLGTVSDPEVGELASRANVESPAMKYNEGDNNTGITVIDITDLDHLRYCYVWFGPRHTDKPETAREYLYRSDDIDENEGKLDKDDELTLEALAKYELISLEALKDCWPGSGWATTTEGNLALEEEQPHDSTSKSLVDISMAKLLDELLSNGDEADLSLLNQTLETPSMRESLIEYCRQNPDKIVEGPSAISVKILSISFGSQIEVDLSPYRKMNPETMRSLLKNLPHVRDLNLSDTLAASDDEITDTLAAISHDLNSLCLLARPDRSVDDPRPAIRAIGKWGFNCRKILISSVLAKTINQKAWWSSMNDEALVQLSIQPSSKDHSADLHGLSRVFPVIQILYKGSSRYKPAVWESFFVGDSLLCPSRFVAGIMNTLRGDLAGRSMGGVGSSLAHGFATAASTLKPNGSLEISALPGETYWYGARADYGTSSNGVSCRLRDLAPDAWTAVIVKHDHVSRGHKRTKAGMIWFGIALLRAKNTVPAVKDQKISVDDVEIVDLETFLSKTSPGDDDVADLKLAMEDLEKFSDEVQPGREPDERIVRPLDAAEAVSMVQEGLDMIDEANAMTGGARAHY